MQNSQMKMKDETLKEIQGEWKRFTKELQGCHTRTMKDHENIKSSDNCFKFFWLDIVERNTDHPGMLYLFGKTYDLMLDSYVSCCVFIKYVHKRCYFLPRLYFYNNPYRKVTWKDIYDEFCETIAPQIEARQIECRVLKKKYAFDQFIPQETDYFEVKCKVGNFELKDKPGNTFSRILGTHTGFKETFLLERNIKGPCWLEVKNYKKDRGIQSNCKVRIECCTIEDIKSLEVHIVPPIIMMGFDFTKFQDTKTNNEKIISVSCIVETTYDLITNYETFIVDHFCIFSNSNSNYTLENLSRLEKHDEIKVMTTYDEDELLFTLIQKISHFDPDILYSHNMLSHHVDLLYSKIAQYKLKNFQKLSKLKLKKIPSSIYRMDILSGRILCDTKVIAEEMVKSKTYSMCELAQKFLEIPYYVLEDEQFKKWLEEFDYCIKLLIVGMWNVMSVHKLMEKFNVLSFLFEITKLCGNTLNDTCEGLLIKRCEYLLLHAFHERNFISPSKFTNTLKTRMSIKGGLVLEPEIGLHRSYVLALDFNSLYPSIIQEFNVCFTTIKILDNGKFVQINSESVLPELINNLKNERKNILQKVATSNLQLKEQFVYLNIKQAIIKKITNSIYGCLGSNGSRFFGEHLANFITTKGREILSNTVSQIKGNSLNVIYGDTDSVMIKTELETYKEVGKMSQKLKQMINSQYKHIVIEDAGIYNPILILRKKKYAGIKFLSENTTIQEIKGLDLVRRDWSNISVLVGKSILTEILSAATNIRHKVYNYLVCIQKDLVENHKEYDINLFAMTKKLSKDPEEYKERENSEHVIAALRYNSTHSYKLKAGDTVCYVICNNDSSKNTMNRAYHIEDFKRSNILNIDVAYYISKQIYPLVKRLCAPLCDFISDDNILKALNADINKYSNNEDEHKKIEFQRKLNSSNNFLMKCVVCEQNQTISYERLDFSKPCSKCQVSLNLIDCGEQLSVVLNNILQSYISKTKTFSETYEILVNIRTALKNNKKNDKRLSEYLESIAVHKNALLSHINCNVINMKEIFRYCILDSI